MTIQIHILGTGCARCEQLAANAHAAANEIGKEFTLEKVSDISQILQFGVLRTPALVVNGQVRCSGTASNVEEIRAILRRVDDEV